MGVMSFRGSLLNQCFIFSRTSHMTRTITADLIKKYTHSVLKVSRLSESISNPSAQFMLMHCSLLDVPQIVLNPHLSRVLSVALF